MKKICIAGAIFVVAFLAINAKGDGVPSVVYVDDDFNSGTPGWGVTHFATIQDAIDAVAEGGVVRVANGIYDGPIVINKEIKLVGDPTIDAHGGIGVSIEANNILVENFTIYNGSTGIYIHNESFTIENVTINNCTIYDCYWDTGIFSYNVSNSWINDTKINDTDLGIYLYNTNYINISQSNISDNDGGIFLENSTNCNISYSNITWNYFGIFAKKCQNITINNNNISYNEGFYYIGEREGYGYGIYLWMTNYSRIINNTMLENVVGVGLENCSYNLVKINNITASLLYLNEGREDRYELLPTGILITNKFYYEHSHNTIQGNNISGYFLGLYIVNTDNETIVENNITWNIVGLEVEDCENISVGSNNISYNVEGVYLRDVHRINITSNYIANNTGDTGIYIDEGCSHINIAGNTICNNDIGIYVYGGLPPYENKDTEIHWNKIYNNSIYGLIYEIEEGETPFINATYNFWGNGNGPSNSSMIDPITGIEAQGTGDAIGGGIANNNIHFDPWIGKLILHKGWNTICLPIWNDSIATAEDLGQYINSIAGYNICTVITKWDSSKQRFVSHIVGFGGNFDLKAGEGYFIFMKNAMNISINGTIIEPEVNITLHIGYNLVGWCRIYPTNAYEIINETNAEKIGRWLNEEQKWDVEVIPPAPYNFDVIIGDAVFIKMLSPGEWNS